MSADKLDKEYDFIVVGSGAGGGPVAVRLAEAGYSVLILEAGGAEEPYDYKVPAFHARSSENNRARVEILRPPLCRPEAGGAGYTITT